MIIVIATEDDGHVTKARLLKNKDKRAIILL